MVRFILGRAGSGKSTYMLDQIQKIANQSSPIYLIVPEQFTFETERLTYHKLGAPALKKVKVLSFTRMIYHVFQQYGGNGGDYADDIIKLILMNQTLREMGDTLQLYAKNARNPRFAQRMLELVGECKHAQISADAFQQIPTLASDGVLKQKTADMASVYLHYDALLGQGYLDSLDDSQKAGKLIRENNYFADSTVFLDEFKSFTENELLLIRLMIAQANDVTISLCTDARLDQKNSLFWVTNQTYQTIKQLGREQGARIASPVILADTHRFTVPALSHLEQHILRNKPCVFDGEQDQVISVLAANEYDESEYVAATIRALVAEQGYRYQDMLVISRDLDSYQNCLDAAFAKYQIPFYLDTVKSISYMPLVRMIGLSFYCVQEGYRSEHMISLLKCGLCGISIQEIAQLENYLYLWNIGGAQWKQDFHLSIFGAKPPQTEQEMVQNELTLASYNVLRKQLVDALEAFRHAIGRATVREIREAVIRLLETLGVRQQLEHLIARLQQDTSDAAAVSKAQEHRRVWEICGELLGKMTTSMGDSSISPQEWQEIFLLLSGQYDMGTIPQTLDSVTIGSAERIRAHAPKVLFVIGACDRIFPYVPESGTLLTERERQQLAAAGITLGGTLKQRLLEEKFVAYKALTLASDRVYMTARKMDMKGNEKLPSYLFAQFKKMFGVACQLDTQQIAPLYYCRTVQTAFSVLADHYRKDTPFTASLRDYLQQNPMYTQKLLQLDHTIHRTKLQLRDPESAPSLYGKTLSMSPSRIEDFHRCKFLYFCKHGMRLFPRNQVALVASSRGMIIHEVLCGVCKKLGDFQVFDESLVKEYIRQEFEHYLDTYLGGATSQSKRFLYLYHRIQHTLLLILRQLFAELSQSGFQPSDYEYRIGAPGNIRPLLISTRQGGKLYLNGQVDRIDVYDAPSGKRYVRVVDYKSGTKNFRLSDIINGLNLQMLIYLLCLEKNGSGFYQNATGAGILYLPVAQPAAALGRQASEQDMQHEMQKHYRMKGLIVNDEEVLKAMEQDLSGKYIPVQARAAAYDEEHTLREHVFVGRHANEALLERKALESLITSEQLGKLFRYVERIVERMADELYQGNIEAKPLREQKEAGLNPCLYCDYHSLCGFQQEDVAATYQTVTKQQLIEELERDHQDAGTPEE